MSSLQERDADQRDVDMGAVSFTTQRIFDEIFSEYL